MTAPINAPITAPTTALMTEESRAAPACVARLLASDASALEELARTLRQRRTASGLTVARGSSDHAAAYFAYLTMQRTGHIVASLPPSLLTLGGAPLQVGGMLAAAFSQSGQSPDLLRAMAALRERGALTVACVNDTQSPLARGVDHLLPLHAGPERSIAATKSFITSLVAGVRLCLAWQADAALAAALQELPADLTRAAASRWPRLVDVLAPARQILVIGRGLSLPIAAEMALKLKETCALQAEAFSGAEVRHGPMALVEPGYPLLIVATRGPALAGLVGLAQDMRQRGAQVLLVAPPEVASRDLDLPLASHPDLDPVVAIQAFYGQVAELARARGLDPDQPRHLSKVTHTV